MDVNKRIIYKTLKLLNQNYQDFSIEVLAQALDAKESQIINWISGRNIDEWDKDIEYILNEFVTLYLLLNKILQTKDNIHTFLNNHNSVINTTPLEKIKNGEIIIINNLLHNALN